MKIIAAYLTLIGCIGWLICILVFMMTDRNIRAEDVFASLVVIIPTVSGIYLIISQKLCLKSKRDKIKEQNEMLRMEIEQANLLKELDEKTKP